MSESGKFAYVTGGASGIGRAVVEMLVKRGIKVFIADRDIQGAEFVASEMNKNGKVASAGEVNVTEWEDQVKCFEKAVAEFGRIDYVYPVAGVGERVWVRNDPKSKKWEEPDLTVIDVDLKGVLLTIGLALQQFRRQELSKEGFRGKIGCVASVCGFYCVPTLPLYTAAKHGVVGFVRSYGKYLPEEKITLNAVCPNVIRTNISTPAFYDSLEEKGLLTPMEPLLEAFESLLGTSETSGECFEIGPKGGYTIKAPPEVLDEPSQKVVDLLYYRGHPLHEPK